MTGPSKPLPRRFRIATAPTVLPRFEAPTTAIDWGRKRASRFRTVMGNALLRRPPEVEDSYRLDRMDERSSTTDPR